MPSSESGSFPTAAHSPFWRAVCSLIILVIACPAIYRSYGIFRADRIARADKTVAGYTKAIGYDPSNATLWWLRGRLYHYSLAAAAPAKAANDYRKALSINPRLAEAWTDLSDCYVQMGRFDEAEAAIEKAIVVRRYSPLIRWQAGNFYLRRQNLPKMYECFKLASEYDEQKLNIAIDVSWKIDPDHERIVDKLIPDNLNANLRYLGFLVARDQLDLASPVWRRFMNNPIPAGVELAPSAAFSYIDKLLARENVDEALGIWDDILRKARSGLSDNRKTAFMPGSRLKNTENLIWNGSFENEILRGGFDWRYNDTPTVQYRIDTANRMQGLKSLRLTFQEENVASGFLYQIVPVPEPGSYQMDVFLRTDGLTTDQLPFLSVQGYPNASGASARSDFFKPSAEWSKLSLPFDVQPRCKAIMVLLLRNKSSKFDNAIKGSLWLDGFSLRKVSN